MEVDKKDLFPPVSHGHSQQLHVAVYMWWEENLTEIFVSRLSGRFWQELGMNPDHPGL
jgi:hypothetical protein